ncbi:membrane-spanning 4-domains subfamily A member 8-like isoform X2 [Sceloporus undulatus]|uniref:membrane-spanning 4-domains subfamily A member 8-like isoform X2 n=1 Tax=Sceloporus undulatus TaxID=8520 RepID=UPI001C4DA4A3|nr:membrane-spanning 4-domains subfamily A member 8-like isoform X2 [Sceloporus undulatus]
MECNTTHSLDTTAQPMKLANGRVVIIDPNGSEQIPSNVMHYIQSGSQQYGSPGGQPQQNSLVRALEKLIKLEAKTLGALQIMIGLIHIGLGIISGIIGIGHYISVAFYPVYSGLGFIASGSVSISAQKHWNTRLMNTSVGMNILSAFLASSGIVAYICELAINLNVSKLYGVSPSYMSVGVGFSVLFLLFSSLEFCITVIVAHFGCQRNCCTDDTT